jgi:HEAT repeat protein
MHMSPRVFFRRINLPLSVLMLALALGGCADRAERQILSDTKRLLNTLEGYRYGDDRSWLPEFQDLMRSVHGHPSVQPRVESLVGRFLGTGASAEAVQMVCLEFRSIATKRSVPALAALLPDERTAHAALTVLRAIEGPEADKALREALPAAPPPVRREIIQVLALRGDRQAIALLADLMADSAVSLDAIHAMGAIGGDEATRILASAYELGGSSRRPPIAFAWLEAAGRCESAELRRQAYSTVFDREMITSLRYQALLGLIRMDADEFAPLLFRELLSEVPGHPLNYIPMLRELPAGFAMDPLLDQWQKLPESTRGPLMLALAERGEPHIRPMVMQSLNSPNPDLKLSAFKALAYISTPDDAALLAGLAAANQGSHQALAREALYLLNGTAADDAIIAALKNSSGDRRAELIRACADRGIRAAAPLLLQDLNSGDAAGRQASVRALGLIGRPEALPALLAQAGRISSPGERAELSTAIARVSGRITNAEERHSLLLTAADNAAPERLLVLLPVMGELGDTVYLPVIRNYLQSPNAALRSASLSALAAWPDAAPLGDLRAAVEGETVPGLRLQAINAYLRSVSMSSLPGEERIAALSQVYGLGRNAGEKKAVADELGRMESPAALQAALDS